MTLEYIKPNGSVKYFFDFLGLPLDIFVRFKIIAADDIQVQTGVSSFNELNILKSLDASPL